MCVYFVVITPQVLMRYTTNKTEHEILQYNLFASIAKDEDVAYATAGEISSQDPNLYLFPFNREIDPLSIIQQCHSMLRARVSTHAFVVEEEDAADTAPGDTAENARKVIFLEAMLSSVRDGVEWKPLNVENIDTTNTSFGSANRIKKMSRHEFIRMIVDFGKKSPQNVLYDARFVSRDSHFCKQPEAEPTLRKQPINMNLNANMPSPMTVLDTKIAEIRAASARINVPAHGMSSRTIGNVDFFCPCETQNEKDRLAGKCQISLALCDVQNKITQPEALKKFQQVFPVCVYIQEDTNVPPPKVTYDFVHKEYVRELLRSHGVLLKQNGFVCDSLRPSDLWGIAPSQFTNQYYIGTSNTSLDALYMLMHPKSGVSLLNYDNVDTNINTMLGEGDREVCLCFQACCIGTF